MRWSCFGPAITHQTCNLIELSSGNFSDEGLYDIAMPSSNLHEAVCHRIKLGSGFAGRSCMDFITRTGAGSKTSHVNCERLLCYQTVLIPNLILYRKFVTENIYETALNGCTFWPARGAEHHQLDTFSISNRREAHIVRKLVQILIDKGVQPTDIGVITPYTLQVHVPFHGPKRGLQVHRNYVLS